MAELSKYHSSLNDTPPYCKEIPLPLMFRFFDRGIFEPSKPDAVCVHIRGPFVNFMDTHYYSESELREGAVTVSFSK